MILICSKTDQVSLWPNRMGPHLANAPNRNSLSKRADIDIFFNTFLTIAPIRRLCRRRVCYAHIINIVVVDERLMIQDCKYCGYQL